MTAATKLEFVNLTETNPSEQDDEYNIPLDISDIINICREYNKLGWKIQNQVEIILEVGVEEAIKTCSIKQDALPHVKNFLQMICKNPYFGDAIFQAQNCISLIQHYEDKNKPTSKSN